MIIGGRYLREMKINSWINDDLIELQLMGQIGQNCIFDNIRSNDSIRSSYDKCTVHSFILLLINQFIYIIDLIY